MKFRVPKPCKYSKLFLERICARCGKNVPEGQEMCSCGEKLQDCSSHKTNSCIYVHPDEPEWEAACDGTLAFNRQHQIFYSRNTPLYAPKSFTVNKRSPHNLSHVEGTGAVSVSELAARVSALESAVADIRAEPLKALNTRSRFTVNKRSPHNKRWGGTRKNK